MCECDITIRKNEKLVLLHQCDECVELNRVVRPSTLRKRFGDLLHVDFFRYYIMIVGRNRDERSSAGSVNILGRLFNIYYGKGGCSYVPVSCECLIQYNRDNDVMIYHQCYLCFKENRVLPSTVGPIRIFETDLPLSETARLECVCEMPRVSYRNLIGLAVLSCGAILGGLAVYLNVIRGVPEMEGMYDGGFINKMRVTKVEPQISRMEEIRDAMVWMEVGSNGAMNGFVVKDGVILTLSHLFMTPSSYVPVGTEVRIKNFSGQPDIVEKLKWTNISRVPQSDVCVYRCPSVKSKIDFTESFTHLMNQHPVGYKFERVWTIGRVVGLPERPKMCWGRAEVRSNFYYIPTGDERDKRRFFLHSAIVIPHGLEVEQYFRAEEGMCGSVYYSEEEDKIIAIHVAGGSQNGEQFGLGQEVDSQLVKCLISRCSENSRARLGISL